MTSQWDGALPVTNCDDPQLAQPKWRSVVAVTKSEKRFIGKSTICFCLAVACENDIIALPVNYHVI